MKELKDFLDAAIAAAYVEKNEPDLDAKHKAILKNRVYHAIRNNPNHPAWDMPDEDFEKIGYQLANKTKN